MSTFFGSIQVEPFQLVRRVRPLQTRDMHNVIEAVFASIPRRQPAKQQFLAKPEIRPLARGELISFQVLAKPLRGRCVARPQGLPRQFR
jgi:hypothetical protein